MTYKDKALEELFLAQKPHFNDNDAFMASLTKRLDAVEYIKQYQEATIRRYKIAMIVSFVIGIISGAFTIAFVLSLPTDIPLFTFHVQTQPRARGWWPGPGPWLVLDEAPKPVSEQSFTLKTYNTLPKWVKA